MYILIYIYCSKEYDNITCKKISKKRKLLTFN